MPDDTAIYGISRGYHGLTIFSFMALIVSISVAFQSSHFDIVASTGALGFGVLFGYSLGKSRRRHVLFTIAPDGLTFVDPAVPVGLVHWEEIRSVRIFATPAHPVVAFSLHDTVGVRNRLPALMRYTVGIIWPHREYAFGFQLDGLDDQVAAVTSAVTRHGIPVISELV